MSSGRNDIRLIELKDTISQLNQTIRVQTEMIKDLRKTIEEHHASDEKKDQIISNLQAEISYLKAKLFGASSEKRRKEDLPGQMSLFDELMEEEPAKEIEPEYIEIKAHERKRKKKPDLNEQFRDIPVRQEFVDTLTEEQKTCSICGTKMVGIGHELIRSEVIFTPAKLERVEYIATTYGCPKCKETEEPQFVKDNGVPATSAWKLCISIACSTCDLSEVHERNATVPAGKRLGTAGSNDHESFHGKMDHSLFQNILSANV